MRMLIIPAITCLIILGSCGQEARDATSPTMRTTMVGDLTVPKSLAGATIASSRKSLVESGLIPSNAKIKLNRDRLGIDGMWSSLTDSVKKSPESTEVSYYYGSPSDADKRTWAIASETKFHKEGVDEGYAIRRYGKPRLIGKDKSSIYLLYTDEPVEEWQKKYAMTRICSSPPECADNQRSYCSEPYNVFRRRVMMVYIEDRQYMTTTLSDSSLLPDFPIVRALPKNSCPDPKPFSTN